MQSFWSRKGALEGGATGAPSYQSNKPLSGYVVLVVEDERLIQGYFCDELKKAGARVESAANAYEAFSKTERWTPDVVLLDIMLPGMTGFQLVHEWSKRSRFLKVVAISGEKTAAADGLEAGKLGITRYLTKPVVAEKLVQTVQEAVLFGDRISDLEVRCSGR